MQADLVVQQPEATGAAELLLLFHGVGSSAEDLAPLGQALAQQRPRAWVVSDRSPDRSELGQGWEWFSVQGVTEENRPARVAAAMPGFMARVAAWQAHAGVPPERTTLIGFSQGAIVALESTQAVAHRIAGRVVAIAARFVQAPRHAPVGFTVQLMHGEQDLVMPVALAGDADRALKDLGAASTLDRFAGLGHAIDARVVEAILQRMADDAQQRSP